MAGPHLRWAWLWRGEKDYERRISSYERSSAFPGLFIIIASVVIGGLMLLH